MADSDLFSELGVDYTPGEQDRFFDELAYVARSATAPLGSNSKGPDKQALVDSIRRMQEELKSCTAEFSKVLQVYPLNAKEFKARGFEISPGMADQMKKYEFALVHVPITLVPVKGWGFTSLDCIVEFNPGCPEERCPTAYQIFTKEEWQEKIAASIHLTMGLDENFNFKVAAAVPPAVQAGIGAEASAGARLALGPFNYSVRMPKILTRGCGNVKVRWSMEGEEYVQQEEPALAIVLKIPRGVRPVKVTGVMAVRCHFHLLSADIQYLIAYLRERNKNFFSQGTPIASQTAVWDLSSQL